MSQATPTGQQAISAPRGVRNSATRIVASTVGVYGGLLGIEHGIGETLQGNGAPNGVLINAIDLEIAIFGNNPNLLNILAPFLLGFFLLTALTAFAHDIQRQIDSDQAPSMSGGQEQQQDGARQRWLDTRSR